MALALGGNERAILKAIADSDDSEAATAKLARDLEASWEGGPVRFVDRMSTELSSRTERAGDAERAVAREMAGPIAEKKGHTVFLDSGPTCLLLAQAMKDEGCSDVAVHTLNPLVVAEFLDYPAIGDLYVAGGRLSRGSAALSGDSAARRLTSEP